LLGGCASVPSDPEGLLASSAIVAEREVERGAVIEVARFSRQTAGGLPDQWEPFVILPATPHTQYRLVATREGTALEANADALRLRTLSAHPDRPEEPSIVEWRWNVVQPVAGADARIPVREDSPARLVISFHGDIDRLDFQERITLRLYKGLTGQTLPYAMLMYIWAGALPAETLIPSEHTGKIQMIVLPSDERHIGQWVKFRRNVLEDYRRIFGEEPSDIVAVGVMSDSDDTREQARAQFGDITFLARAVASQRPLASPISEYTSASVRPDDFSTLKRMIGAVEPMHRPFGSHRFERFLHQVARAEFIPRAVDAKDGHIDLRQMGTAKFLGLSGVDAADTQAQ
jgi:hypothetical protein